jgi:simple sugar transport system permease protein
MTGDVAASTAPKPNRRADALRRTAGVLRLDQFALFPVIILAVIVGALVNDAFLTQTNLVNVLRQSSELSILVMAEALILIAGKFDLSLESIVGLAPAVAAWLVLAPDTGGGGIQAGAWVGLAALFGVGILVGIINATSVVYLKLNAFMTTLAMLILLRGITIGLTGGQTMYDLPSLYTWLGDADLAGLPVSVWLAGLLFLVAGLFLRYHRWGRALYAIGGNAEAARAAGIRVDRIVWVVYVLAGALAALAGLMLTGRLASVVSSQGQNMIFTVFAAAVIGRISLNGGRGTMIGALSGVLLLGIIGNILTLSAIESFWISAAFGGIILLALVIARFTAGEVDES